MHIEKNREREEKNGERMADSSLQKGMVKEMRTEEFFCHICFGLSLCFGGKTKNL